jgi:hypothetical protein
VPPSPSPAPAPTPAPGPNLPPVAITPDAPKPPTKPVEVPEPGTTTALALSALGAFRLLKRKKDVTA